MKYLLFIVFFISTTAKAQRLVGQIMSDQENVPFATLVVKDFGIGTSSDANGNFSIQLPEAGSYTLIISCVGFEKLFKKFSVGSEGNTNIQIELIKNTSSLEEVVITGTMKESTMSDSPAPIQILDPTFFKMNPTPSVFEAIGMVNGVRPQINCNVCSTGDIHINGMEGPYTMVLIDGMPIVSSLSTVYGLMGIPNSMVQRIEVMKGPASTLYGSEAVGGLINIITKDPLSASKIALDFNHSSYNETILDGSTSFKKNKIAGLFSANYFGIDKRWDINNDNFTDIPTVKRFSLFNKWTIGKTRPLNIAARYIHEDRFGGELQWQKTDRGGEQVYGESIYTNRWELLANHSLLFGKEDVKLQFSYNNHNQNSVYGSTKYLASQQVGFAQATWDKKLNKTNDALIGIALRSTIYDDNTTATQDENADNQASVTLLPGVFIQNETTFSDKIKLLSGLRYDYNSLHGGIFSPRFNLKYAPNKEQTFRLSLGNGYRVVNIFSEDHAALTGARVVQVANDLAPEQSYNANLDFQQFWTGKNGFGEFQANIFYTYFSNKIIADYDIDPELIVYQNLIGHGVSRGLALSTAWNFDSFTKIDFGVTIMEVFSKEGQEKIEQIQTPNLTGNYSISQRIPRWNVRIDLNGTITSPMRLPVVPEYGDERSPYSPWFSSHNLQIRKSFSSGLEVYAGLKNILNYIPRDPIFMPNEPFSEQFDPSYSYAPLQGRRAFLGIRYELN